jgi:NADPH:quinone reductase-like Zn-dependent oxidoreductase
VIRFYEPLPVTDERSSIDLDLPIPAPGSRDLLVSLLSVSVNPVDMKRRRDTPPSERPRILGFDCAGVVEAVEAKVSLFRQGDECSMPARSTDPALKSKGTGG